METINADLPLQLFQSGQLLSLPTDRPVGLILQQPHYADFAGCGAAIGGSFDIKCTSIYIIGHLQFSVPETYTQRQQSFQHRLVYMRIIHRITAMQSPLQRAFLMVRQLVQWLGLNEAKTIPDELIAQLIGVLPKTVTLGWQQYLRTQRSPRVHPDTPLIAPIAPSPANALFQPLKVK